MFCPECGFSNPVPGVVCPRCGTVLPRTRGSTFVLPEEPTDAPPAVTPAPEPPPAAAPIAAPVAPPQAAPFYPPTAPTGQPHASPEPVAQAPADPFAATAYGPQQVLAAAAPAFVAQPAAPAYAAQLATSPQAQAPAASSAEPDAAIWGLDASDTRSGLVWRSIVGAFSVILGGPLIPFSILFLIAVMSRYGVDRIHFLVIPVCLLLLGVFESLAGIGMLRGASSPHVNYIVALVVQFVGTLAIAAALFAQDSWRNTSSLIVAGVLLLSPMLIPILRWIPFRLKSSGAVLGTAGSTSSYKKRAVPFVLWGPIFVLAASPLLVPSALASLVVMVMAWVEPPDGSYLYGALLSAGGLLQFVFVLGVFAAAIGLLRRSRWSVAVGGVAGAIGTLATVVGFGALAVYMTKLSINDDSVADIMLFGIALTVMFVPCVSLLIGAVKFKFRLPGYLNVAVPEGGERPKLMDVLVP